MEQIRARVDTVVRDAGTAEALKPWYRQFCKRPCFHDDYLPTLQPRQRLPRRHRRTRRRTDHRPGAWSSPGEEYEVDCIIFATGFEVGTAYTRRSGYDVVGSDGITLSEHWTEGMRSLHGMHVHGFPNMFVLGHTQGGFTVNYPHLLDEAEPPRVPHHAPRHRRRPPVVEATEDGEAEWMQTLAESARDFRAFQEQCTPGYYNNEGQPAAGGFLGTSYGLGPMAFFKLLENWRNDAHVRRPRADPLTGEAEGRRA